MDWFPTFLLHVHALTLSDDWMVYNGDCKWNNLFSHWIKIGFKNAGWNEGIIIHLQCAGKNVFLFLQKQHLLCKHYSYKWSIQLQAFTESTVYFSKLPFSIWKWCTDLCTILNTVGSLWSYSRWMHVILLITCKSIEK